MQSQYEETTHEEFFVTTSMKEIELDIYTTKIYLFNGKRIKNHYIITNIRHLARAKRFLSMLEHGIRKNKEKFNSLGFVEDADNIHDNIYHNINCLIARQKFFKTHGIFPSIEYTDRHLKFKKYKGIENTSSLKELEEVLESAVETYERHAEEYIKEIQPDHEDVDFTPLLYKKQMSTGKSAAKTS